ncbi:MAG: type III PLP-dependent enzyme [Spirochaetia bacterium]|nr:type III PLP-dependent enzyme [Spirochaetia bacterium]
MNTPVLIMDRSKIISNYREMKSAFTDFHIAYAMKSNSHNDILNLLLREDSDIETASISEIQLLIERGVSPEKIIFSNPVKPESAIRSAVESGVFTMTFDSLSELKKFIPYKEFIKPILRIDVANEGSLWVLSGKFGCPKRVWPQIFQYMKDNEITLSGITFHVGSQCEMASTWGKAIAEVGEAALMAETYNLKPEILNIGGGFPINLGRDVPTVKDIANVVYKAINDLEKKGIVFEKFYAEPGRFISGSAGTLCTRVIGVGDRDIKGQSEKWVFLDTGVFSGLMETIDGITYPLYSNGSGEIERVMLCGPSCDGADKMFKAFLPSPKVGDIIYMYGTGAYTMSYSSNFNGIEPPSVSFVDKIENKVENFKLN